MAPLPLETRSALDSYGAVPPITPWHPSPHVAKRRVGGRRWREIEKEEVKDKKDVKHLHRGKEWAIRLGKSGLKRRIERLIGGRQKSMVWEQR